MTVDGNNKIKVFIIDAYPIIRHGLKYIINKQDNLIVCGETTNIIPEMHINYHIKPDIITLEIVNDETCIIDLIAYTNSLFPDTPILVISHFQEAIYAEIAIKAGAKGYIMKTELPSQIITALYTVLGGDIYLNANIRKKVFENMLI